MRNRCWAAGLIVGLALIVTAIDQMVKGLVVRALPLGESQPVIPGILSLTYRQNVGVAFSTLHNVPMPVIVTLNLVMIAVFVALTWRHARTPLGMAAAVLVLGGAFGNLIDRVWRHYVVDYLDIHVWPVFNIADTCIVAGVALLLMVLFRADREKTPCEGGA